MSAQMPECPLCGDDFYHDAPDDAFICVNHECPLDGWLSREQAYRLASPIAPEAVAVLRAVDSIPPYTPRTVVDAEGVLRDYAARVDAALIAWRAAGRPGLPR